MQFQLMQFVGRFVDAIFQHARFVGCSLKNSFPCMVTPSARLRGRRLTTTSLGTPDCQTYAS